MQRPDYIAIARQYAADVLAGRIPACKWVRLACERQTRDLEQAAAGTFPFRFDEKAASRVCWFIENLTHTKGELAGRKIHLEPWQVFILTTVFGWLTEAGNRRYRRSYIEVPRGNGKSCLSSGVALFCLCADHEPGAEVYSFATTRDQAGIVFGDAKRMAEQNADLRSACGVAVLAHALYVAKTASTMQAKSADGSTLDGLNTHLAVVDELHAHKRRDVYDVVETSLGKRRNSLMWVITTSGVNRAGICYEVRGLVTKVLQNVADDPSQFGIIYSLDDGDDWKTEAALVKANPNWGVSVRPEVLRSLQAKAIAVPSAENNFKTKHLDIWCNADSGWMDMKAWGRCADSSLSADDFEGQPCFIGLDLASKIDIAAKVRIFPRDIDGETHYYIFGDYWLPRSAVENGSNSQYSGWEYQGLLHVTDGATTDYGQIKESILEDCRRFDVIEVPYDPFQATQLSNELGAEGVPMLEMRQTVANLSEPMKSFQALVLEGRMHHNGDPVLTWMVSNVVCHVDAKENIYPRKEFPENKIDGVVAGLMALNRALATSDQSADLNAFLEL